MSVKLVVLVLTLTLGCAAKQEAWPTLLWRGSPAMQWWPDSPHAVKAMQTFFREHGLQYLNHGGLLRYCRDHLTGEHVEGRAGQIVWVPKHGTCLISNPPSGKPHRELWIRH